MGIVVTPNQMDAYINWRDHRAEYPAGYSIADVANAQRAAQQFNQPSEPLPGGLLGTAQFVNQALPPTNAPAGQVAPAPVNGSYGLLAQQLAQQPQQAQQPMPPMGQPAADMRPRKSPLVGGK